MVERNIIVIGVDACTGGWVFIRLENGAFASAAFYEDFADGVLQSNDVAVIGVDMPIGYPPPPAQERAADGEARTFVRPLTSTVFPALHPCVLLETDRVKASAKSRKLTGKGIGSTAFALRGKMLEVAPIAAHDDRIHEVHPEVSFRELANQLLKNDPLASKNKWNGHRQRHALLVAAGIQIPDDLGNAGTAAADDILDAAVAAWSANRIALRVATSMPNPPQIGADGGQVAIWY